MRRKCARAISMVSDFTRFGDAATRDVPITHCFHNDDDEKELKQNVGTSSANILYF